MTLPDTKVYAVYEDETFICMGTPTEICERLELKRNTFWQQVGSYLKWEKRGGTLPKRVVFCLDDEDNEEECEDVNYEERK